MRKIQKNCALALIVVLLCSLIPVSVNAAISNSDTFSVNGLSISDSGSCTWTVTSANALSGSIGEFREGTSKDGTLTFTNSSGSEAVLSFDLAYYLKAGGSGGKSHIAINGTQYVTTEGAGTMSAKYAGSSDLSNTKTLTYTLAPDGTVAIKVTATAGYVASGFAKVAITNVNLKVKTTANVTFVPDSTVSYTVGYVDGDGASQTVSVTAGGTENVTLEAELSESMSITPADGYICESATGSTSGTVFADKNGEFTFAKNETVTPVFLSSSTTKPFTHLGVSKSYATLGAAVNAGSGIVVLNQNYTLPAGNYTIPYGVQLLLPYSEANIFRGKPNDWTLHDMSLSREGFPDPPEVNIVSAKVYKTTPNVEYCRMTMAEGAHITVNGSLEVSGQTHPLASGQLGNYAVLQMGNNTSITVGSTGTLYAYGYIRGNGTVTVESKGVVYEHYDVADYPPGGAGGLDPMNTAGVFGMTNYTFNNVEVPTTYKAGAKLGAYLVMTGYNIGTNAFTRDFIGSDADAVFDLKSGTITKTYSGGRQNFVIAGGVELNKLYIKINAIVKEYVVDSSKTSGLPISHNWDITIKDGAAATLNGSVLMYAGSTLTIENGGKLVIPSGIKFSLLDPESDPSGVTANSVLDLNGEVQVNGGFYNSCTGTSIPVIKSSEGTGKVTVNAVGTETTFNVRASGDNTAAVNITPAKLQNSDSTIVDTAKGGVNTYTYTDGKWICTTHTEEETIQTPAACETAGVKTVTCKVCGTTRTEEIPALTHKDENPKDHICDNGCEVYQGTHADGDDNDHLCDYCNGTVEGDVCVDNNNDHNCDECGTSISACVDEGKDHKCDICGKNVGTHEAAQGTHICAYCNQKASDCDYTVRGDIVTKANCVTNAVYKAKCSVCGTVSETKTITGEVDSRKHTGNTDVRNAKSATCAAEGYTGDTHCSDCNVKLEDGTTIKKLTTHTYPETWTQTKAPTCTEKGSEERKCTVEGCDAIETREVKELDHDWATTLTQGETTHWYNCSRCDETKDVANHNYTWTTTQEATCYQDGSKSGTCSCGATATEVIDATGEHTFSETYTTENGSHWRACTTTGCTEKTDEGICSGGAATCTTPATCSVCGQSYGTVDENAHNWGNWEVTTPASCTAEGEETRICSNNVQHTETKVIAKTAHAMTHHVRVEATCVAAGNVEYWNCSGCGLNYSDENGTTKLDSVDIAINSDAHDLKNVAAQSATCIQIGWDAYQKCQREGCNYSTYVEIPKLDHTDADNDGDHLCDADGCSEVVTTCEDTGKDHICDSDSACNIYGTGNNAHVDSDNDHACDYGCKVSIGECKDGDDADHKCDYGCGKDNLTDHNYGTEWKCDTTNHWHECACGEKSDLANHSYDDGVVTKEPTTEAEGEMAYTCKCGYSYTETIDKLVPQGYTVKIVNYTANDANLATVTIDGNAVEYQKKVAVEATLGTDGILTVSCARACVVAYTTNDIDYMEVYAVANDNGSYSFTIDAPVEGMTITVLHSGDVDLSGSVNTSDAGRLKRNVAGRTISTAQISALGKVAADVDSSGTVNTSDAGRLKRNVAGRTISTAQIKWRTK